MAADWGLGLDESLVDVVVQGFKGMKIISCFGFWDFGGVVANFYLAAQDRRS